MDVAPHLSSRLIAKPLDEIRMWRLPEDADLLSLHRGVLRALVATDALTRLELPQDIAAPRLDDAREVAEWSVVSVLLEQAEGTLASDAHRQRIAHLHGTAPGHARQLERLRQRAVERLKGLRMRVDFVCGGQGAIAAAREPAVRARTALPQ
jgi:hypothetical protein